MNNPVSLRTLFDHFLFDGVYKHDHKTTVAAEVL
jgi:hypothetical protein